MLITVKTYPIPSAKYDELVCTAGVQEDGTFVRLYPINFRDLPYSQQYRKYQWIEAEVRKHTGRDVRKESYRPNCDTIRLIGEPIPTNKGDWSNRAKFALAKKSASMEHLYAQQEADRTSLGIFKPKAVHDLVVTPDEADWKPGFKAALAQARLWENRTASLEPPRKVPFKFQYVFACDEPACKGHCMMIEDWEVGALYWRCINGGSTQPEACEKVRQKFLGQLCASDRDTHFYVGTILAYPKSWVVIGVYWPRRRDAPPETPLPLLAGLD
ncbi:MAG TPA: hypothetical protein VN841_13495 [Bryobacteraceae bacterium]|nr:hypothetical protein [Bryobacteraceae bacterium]